MQSLELKRLSQEGVWTQGEEQAEACKMAACQQRHTPLLPEPATWRPRPADAGLAGDFLRLHLGHLRCQPGSSPPPSITTRALPTAPASCTRTHTLTHTQTRTAGIPSLNTALPEPVLVQLDRGSTVWPPNPRSYLVSPLLPPWSGSSLGAGLDLLTACSLPVE